MSTRPPSPRSGLLASAGLVVLAGLAVGGALVLGRPGAAATPTEAPAQPPVTAPAPAPEPDPEPEPCPYAELLAADDPACTPPPEPVRGDVEVVELIDLSVTDSGLFRAGSDRDAAVAPDDDAIAAAVRTAVGAVDALLTLLQEGGEPDLSLTGEANLHSLASPTAPVSAASYDVHVGARGGPEWLEVRATILREDGEHTTTFAFEGGEDPELIAILVEPEVSG